jgi:hypothetical protein
MKYKSRIKKGELRHWLISGANYDVNGKVTGSIGIHLDITDQNQEERIQLLSLIAEKNINAVVITDEKGRLGGLILVLKNFQAIPKKNW